MAAEPTEQTQFPDTPEGWASRWRLELSAARNELEKWHRQGGEVVKQFRDERDGKAEDETRWNLFSANVLTQQATLYGQTPKVSVSRRFADASDDVARVAAEMLERLLNNDIEKDSDTFAQALQYALEDRLLPGFGLVRVRYEVDTEKVKGTPAILDETGAELAPAVPEAERVSYECVETDYVHWRDVLWSPARVWHEVRWLAFRAQMSREQLVERFPETGKAVPLSKQPAKDEDGKDAPTPWARAEVWEVWDKETERVFWYVEGHPSVLDSREDPLGLEGFWPCPRPLLANSTTTSLVPRPDYVLAQDLYREVNELSSRIHLLVDAVRAAGVYDQTAGALQQLLDGTKRNVLIPVSNWALLAEKGGLRGVIDWMPLEQVVGAITALRDYRREVVDALHQVTGMADIMRGQASTPGTTATEQAVKARFGSVRLQRLQDEVARFASDVQRLKSEVIAKHFRPESIIAASNVEHTPDAALAQEAVDLLKDRLSHYRIEVKPEAVSLTDFAALKSERMEVVQALASFLTAAAPAAQAMPGSVPFLLELLQATVAGLRGSSTLEGVLDRAIAQAQQQAAQPKGQQAPDPKLQAQQLKGQQDMAKLDKELQNDVIRTQVEVQADAQREANQREQNVMEAAQKAQLGAATRAMQPQKPGGMP